MLPFLPLVCLVFWWLCLLVPVVCLVFLVSWSGSPGSPGFLVLLVSLWFCLVSLVLSGVWFWCLWSLGLHMGIPMFDSALVAGCIKHLPTGKPLVQTTSRQKC
ncbi:hypothetical protein BDF14DRAFT_1788177 [Spinellus fusiger]|nr:hypothetical protein BDF14DRAFT_1788177 [Spinellus fusiger]